MGIPEKKTKNRRNDPKEDPLLRTLATKDYIKNYYNRILATKEFIPFIITIFYQLILGEGISGTPVSLVPYFINELYVR